MKKILLFCFAMAGCVGVAQNIMEDPPFTNTFFGAPLVLDARVINSDAMQPGPLETFLAADDQAGFCSFTGVSNVVVKDGKLSFIMAKDTAILGWGNEKGGKPEFRVSDFPQQFGVKLSVSHPDTGMVWSVVYRDKSKIKYAKYLYHGGRGIVTGVLNQAGTTLDFELIPALLQKRWDAKKNELPQANPGSGWLEFVVNGRPGTEVVVDSLSLVYPQVPAPLCARYEFVLPEGKIWRAVADLRGSIWRGYDLSRNRVWLHVNGHVVEMREPEIFGRSAHALDIASCLIPGAKNVVGLRVEQPYTGLPVIYFQSRIVMESGALTEVISGRNWRYKFTAQAPQGWDQLGFDASAWSMTTSSPAMDRAHVRRNDVAGDFWLPAYQGRLFLDNPAGRELVFTDTTNVVLEARIPSGMQSLMPEVVYKIGRCHNGDVAEVQGGMIKEASADGDSLVYRMDLGKLPGGVYVAALALQDKSGATIETRPREPFVVIAASKGDVVTGKSYTEGLDLELEDTIDCTDPNDPHPTFESCPNDGEIKSPVIINKAGLRYREVSSWRRSAGFSYRIEFKHPGSFYLIEVEYPDDTKRIIEVIVNGKRTGVWNNCQSASGAETGGRHLPTGKMQKLQWLHVADNGVHSMDIVNHHNNEKGAAGRIKIYRVKGRLPELAVGYSREFGHYTERTSYGSGIANVFGVCRIGAYDNSEFGSERNLPLMAWHIKYLEWMNATYDRYIQWMKFSGRNLHVLGCYQYNEANTPLLSLPNYRTARVSQCPRRILAQFMDANNIAFYSEVEWTSPPRPLLHQPVVINPQVVAGADTPRMINRDGNQVVTWNWLHPEVRASYEKLVDNLVNTFGDLKNYRGVHAGFGPRGEIHQIPAFAPFVNHLDALFTSYDDVTFELFEKETGTKTGITFNDPNRFQSRVKLIEENAALRAQFLAWRGRKLTELYAGVAARIKQKRGDLDLALIPIGCVYHWENMAPQLFEVLEKNDKAMGLDAYLKLFGINVQELDAAPGVFVGRWAVAWIRSRQNKYNTTQDPYIWLGQTAPKYTDFFNRYSPDRRYVMLFLDWNESYLNGPSGTKTSEGSGCARLGDSDWIMTRQLVRCQSQFGGLNAREPITQTLIVSDPNMLVHGFSDMPLPVGHEQALRGIVRVMTYLPKELFEPVLNTRLDTNLAIRQLKKGKDTWFYVANPCQWPVKGWLELKNGGTICSVPDDKKLGRDITKLPIELEPFGLLAFRSDAAECQIMGYHTEPLDKEWVERITGVVQSIRAFVKANAVKYMLTIAEQTALEMQLKEIDALLAKGEYAAAWSALTLPEVWKYYIYEPSVEERYFGEDLARRKKEKLSRELSLNPACLPSNYALAKRSSESPRVLPALRAAAPIKIDGVLAEAAWEGAEFSSDFWSWADQTNALVGTGICARYDEQALYLAFVCADPDTADLKADARGEKDLWTIGEDALGFLLYPKAQGIYYQFGFNTKKARFDQQCIVGGKKLYEEYQPEWKFASQAHQKYWVAEARIPWKAIGLEAPPAELGFNALRVFRYRAVEGGSWNPTPNAHDLNHFGVLVVMD